MAGVDISLKDLSSELKAAIDDLRDAPEATKNGIVTRVGDGIAWIFGLNDAGYNEMIEIETTKGDRVTAFALNLMEDEIGAVILGDDTDVVSGAKVHMTGKVVEVPVGPELIGRVIDPLGKPLDGKGPIKTTKTDFVEKLAPGVMDRKSVHEPVMTGIMSIDAMIPIGRGQRELIIGDRKTGKTAVAIDTMINQARQDSDIVSIYVAIGQKNATVARLVERLRKEGVMDKAIVISTSASDPAPLQFLAPYAGATIGEYFRDNKQHALIIYDDLSKHAVAYRQMSLLLRRPPGREAYPGDVFYLHSRLLERSAKMSDEKGAGSLTALPIIETQADDISAFVPTNVISITDGQIFLKSDLFNKGVRPAVDVGLSVSRVGGAAQRPNLKKVSGNMRLELAQFRELEAFSQFSSDLDEDTKSKIERGKRLTELLKQPQYSPLSLAEQVAIVVAATGGNFDTIPVDHMVQAKTKFVKQLHSEHKKLVTTLSKGEKPTSEELAEIKLLADSVAKQYEDKSE
ncbi:F0F1 ATP synthase subunit alpha [Candidatus Saccharibacteria bacterium]|nr:F0F1 ATP synthase subunit alpha [Candidatus Saccharibacteria bacterium]